MPSAYITDFKFGMDRRGQRYASVPGSLWTARNVVINRRGDIERAKRFVPTYTLPTGQTFGCVGLRGQLWVFGSVPNAAVPLGVQYQQLVSPTGAPMTGVLDARAVNGQLYVVAQFVDGNVFHYYNGSRITSWDSVADSVFSYAILADYLASLIDGDANVSAFAVGSVITITARNPGTSFSYAKSTIDYGGISDQDISLSLVQANVAGVPETRATTTCTVSQGTTGIVSSLTVNGVQLLNASVPFTTTQTQLASDIATQINNKTTSGYTAVASGTNITISAPVGVGATANNYAVATVSSGDIIVLSPSMSGGVTAVTGVAQVVTATLVGTPQSQDAFTITINGTDYKATGRAASTGTTAFVATRRVFSTAGSLLPWSVLNTYNDFTSNPGLAAGSGNINVANDAEGSERLVGCGRYLNQMAVFSRQNCRIYSLNTDATQIGLVQPVDNTGSLAARAIINYGGNDTIYLDETGIRSLRPRDTVNTAYVADIGIAMDTFVRAQLDTLTGAVYGRAVSVIEPKDGRLWMAIGQNVYVLSYFPSAQISAWTYFQPGFQITDFARIKYQLYARAGDTIYQYGGPQGTTYPNAGELVSYIELPYITSPGSPRELLQSYDQAASGEWQVTACVDPARDAMVVNIGTLDGITYAQQDIGAIGRATHVAFNFTCQAAGYASISNLNIHAQPIKGDK